MGEIADRADFMGDTADILARCRREAGTSSAEARLNSAAAKREHSEIGVAANGPVVTGAAVSGVVVGGPVVTGAAVGGAVVTGAAVTGAATIGVGTPLGAGAFLTRLTTAIILMGITLGIGTDLVIPSAGVGTHIGAGAFLTCTPTTAFILAGTILRIGTLTIITIAPYQEGDSLGPNPSRNSRLRTRLRRTRCAVIANLFVDLSVGQPTCERVATSRPLKAPLSGCLDHGASSVIVNAIHGKGCAESFGI
jgi:hypothetical protein